MITLAIEATKERLEQVRAALDLLEINNDYGNRAELATDGRLTLNAVLEDLDALDREFRQREIAVQGAIDWLGNLRKRVGAEIFMDAMPEGSGLALLEQKERVAR
jgi:hypothetical protein